MKRHLELNVIKSDNKFIYFKIGKQSHRTDDFSPNGRFFKASNGLSLRSLFLPSYDPTDNILFVKGSLQSDDNTTCKCSYADFSMICEALTEYNETDGAGYSNEWPKKNDTYYFITLRPTVAKTEFTGGNFDAENKAMGNCFKTAQQAIKILNLFEKFMRYRTDY